MAGSRIASAMTASSSLRPLPAGDADSSSGSTARSPASLGPVTLARVGPGGLARDGGGRGVGAAVVVASVVLAAVDVVLGSVLVGTALAVVLAALVAFGGSVVVAVRFASCPRLSAVVPFSTAVQKPNWSHCRPASHGSPASRHTAARRCTTLDALHASARRQRSSTHVSVAIASLGNAALQLAADGAASIER